jgi:hypothetical protein
MIMIISDFNAASGFFQNGDGLSISEIAGLPTPAIFSHAGNALRAN